MEIFYLIEDMGDFVKVKNEQGEELIITKAQYNANRTTT